MAFFAAVTALEDDILLLTESWCGAISPNLFLTQCGQSIVLKRTQFVHVLATAVSFLAERDWRPLPLELVLGMT